MNVTRYSFLNQPNERQCCPPQWVTRVAGIAVIMGLISISLPLSPAIAARDSRSDFRRCAAALTGLNLSTEEAISACSRALKPQDLHKCVTKVSKDGYEPAEALNACRQVRQPEDMAACVTDIRQRLTNSVAGDVLDNCRRSLLPVRYANCVIGISRGASALTPAAALSSCNDALYFPREVDPTFIPYSTAQPSLLLPETLQPTPAPEPIVTPAPVPAPVPAPAPAPTGPVRGLY